MREYSEDTWQSKDEKDRAKNSVYCHIRHHLGEYTNYIFSTVTPRIAQEIPQLISRQKDSTGNFIQIGEKLSRGDLFHGHVRVPILKMEESKSAIHPIFKNEEAYHLQYHSFETFGLFSADWIEELSQTENAELRKWLLQLKAHRDFEVEDSDYTSGAYGSGPQPPPVEQLTAEKLQKFAELWANLQKDSMKADEDSAWLIERNKKKLLLLDPNQYGAGTSILRNRSVMTTNDFIGILGNLNLSDYMQPANIYFAKRSDHPAINSVIEKAEVHKLNKILNPEARHLNKDSFSSSIDWNLQGELVNSLKRAFAQEDISKSIFSSIAHSEREFEGMQAYSWDDEYIFAIRYSIHCK